VVLGLHDTRGQKTLDYSHVTARSWLPGCFPNRRILLHQQTQFIKILLPEVQRQHTDMDRAKHCKLQREKILLDSQKAETATGESKNIITINWEYPILDIDIMYLFNII